MQSSFISCEYDMYRHFISSWENAIKIIIISVWSWELGSCMVEEEYEFLPALPFGIVSSQPQTRTDSLHMAQEFR